MFEFFAFQFTYLLLYLFVSNTSYYVEVENGALLCDVMWLWKMILGGHGKVLEKFYGKNVWILAVMWQLDLVTSSAVTSYIVACLCAVWMVLELLSS